MNDDREIHMNSLIGGESLIGREVWWDGEDITGCYAQIRGEIHALMVRDGEFIALVENREGNMLEKVVTKLNLIREHFND